MTDTIAGPKYITAPGNGAHHIKRPSGSLGSGSWLAIAIRSGRGDQTYCGRPIGADWGPADGERPCGSCLRAEFANDDDDDDD